MELLSLGLGRKILITVSLRRYVGMVSVSATTHNECPCKLLNLFLSFSIRKRLLLNRT